MMVPSLLVTLFITGPLTHLNLNTEKPMASGFVEQSPANKVPFAF